MSDSEHKLQNDIRNALAGECILFRANVGQAWTGSHVDKLPGGRVLIHDARPFTSGLPVGFSDCFGAVQYVITPDMVGTTRAEPLFGEIKTVSGKVSDKQAAFLRAMTNFGARAGVWRSVEDALRMVRGVNER